MTKTRSVKLAKPAAKSSVHKGKAYSKGKYTGRLQFRTRSALECYIKATKATKSLYGEEEEWTEDPVVNNEPTYPKGMVLIVNHSTATGGPSTYSGGIHVIFSHYNVDKTGFYGHDTVGEEIYIPLLGMCVRPA